MTRLLDRRKAINLRKLGKTYSDIKKELNVSKSTLSGWLSGYDLTEKQLYVLKKRVFIRKELAIEKYRSTMQKKRNKRLEEVYEMERNKLLPLSGRELYLAGLFLYWGEGNKSSKSGIILSNSDPRMIKFYLYWLINCLEILKDKIKVYVHLYSDMNIPKELEYWNNILNIPKSQFCKPYIKENKRINIDQKGFGHGTCNIVINSVRLKEKMIEGLKAVSNYYLNKFDTEF